MYIHSGYVGRSVAFSPFKLPTATAETTAATRFSSAWQTTPFDMLVAAACRWSPCHPCRIDHCTVILFLWEKSGSEKCSY